MKSYALFTIRTGGKGDLWHSEPLNESENFTGLGFPKVMVVLLSSLSGSCGKHTPSFSLDGGWGGEFSESGGNSG